MEINRKTEQTTDENIAHAHRMWLPKATNTQSECVTLIAIPLQQPLHARASLLLHTYIACLFHFIMHLVSQTVD